MTIRVDPPVVISSDTPVQEDPFTSLEVSTLVANQASEWQLPEIDLSPLEFLVEVTITADPPLKDQLTYDPQTNSIKFSGTLEDGSIPIVTTAEVRITIVTSLRSQSYLQ